MKICCHFPALVTILHLQSEISRLGNGFLWLMETWFIFSLESSVSTLMDPMMKELGSTQNNLAGHTNLNSIGELLILLQRFVLGGIRDVLYARCLILASGLHPINLINLGLELQSQQRDFHHKDMLR